MTPRKVPSYILDTVYSHLCNDCSIGDTIRAVDLANYLDMPSQKSTIVGALRLLTERGMLINLFPEMKRNLQFKLVDIIDQKVAIEPGLNTPGYERSTYPKDPDSDPTDEELFTVTYTVTATVTKKGLLSIINNPQNNVVNFNKQ